MGKTLRGAAVLVVFAAAVYLSHRQGAPAELPGAALGWPLLLHVERAGALLTAAGVVLLMGWRATRGDFPIRFGHVEYASTEEVRKAGSSYERRIKLIEAALALRPESVDPDKGKD